MGLSSSKQKSTSKPVYDSQITGAANNISATNAAQQPKITGITDQLAGIVPNLLSQYTNGDSGVNAAKAYNSDVLSGQYLDAGNPYLDSIVTKGENDARNQTAAALGTRGLTGGSDFANIVSRNVLDAGNTLRYNDYSSERDRMAQAASQAPALAAAGYLPISAIESIAQDQQLPVQTATGAGAGIGGLLGQYTNTTTKSSPSLGMLLASIAGNAASAWAGGGFK